MVLWGLIFLIGCLFFWPKRISGGFIDKISDRAPLCFLLLMDNTRALYEYVALLFLLYAELVFSTSNHAIQTLDILAMESTLIIIMLHMLKEPDLFLWKPAFRVNYREGLDEYSTIF